MNRDKRKDARLRVQSHSAILSFRKQITAALDKLPPMLPADADKLAKRVTLTRRFLGGKMPKRVVQLVRGSYAVRPCISGVVITAAVFASLGGRENHKLCEPMTRLSDAIAYHFRSSRMRSGQPYNYDIEQAKLDAEYLQPQLEALAKILIECGVPVMDNPISAIQWGTTSCDHSETEKQITLAEYQAIAARVKDLEEKRREDDSAKNGLATIGQYDELQQRIDALEDRVTELEATKASRPKFTDTCFTDKPVDAISTTHVESPKGIPSSF